MQINKIIHTIILIALAGFVFYSCEKEIIFKGEEAQAMMVLNGFLSTENDIKINLTKSKFFLSNDNGVEWIHNADVHLYVNGDDKGKMTHLDKGDYISNVRPATGDSIQIKVKGVNLPAIQTNKVAIPEPANIVSIDTLTRKIDRNGQGGNYFPDFEDYDLKEIVVQLKIQDPENQVNFYALSVKKRDEYFYSDTTFVQEYSYYFTLEGNESANPEITDIFDGMMGSSPMMHLITDEFFDGQKKSFRFKIEYLHDYSDYSRESSTDSTFTNPLDSMNMYLIVNFESLSPEMYYYLTTKAKAKSIGDNGMFAEPVMVYSNIENGTGILGAHINREIVIGLP